MIAGVVVRRLRPIRDERGELCELMRSDDPLFRAFGQLYYTTARPGVVKAWHRHARQTDHLMAVGPPVRIAMVDGREASPTFGEAQDLVAGRDEPTLVQIPPGVWHGFTPAGDEDALVLNLPTELYDYDDPDEIRLDPFDNDLAYDWRAHGAVTGG